MDRNDVGACKMPVLIVAGEACTNLHMVWGCKKTCDSHSEGFTVTRER